MSKLVEAERSSHIVSRLLANPYIGRWITAFQYTQSLLHLGGITMKEVIETKQAPQAIGPYSQARMSGNFLFSSGQIPINPQTGTVVEGGIASQTKQVMENLKQVLLAAE